MILQDPLSSGCQYHASEVKNILIIIHNWKFPGLRHSSLTIGWLPSDFILRKNCVWMEFSATACCSTSLLLRHTASGVHCHLSWPDQGTALRCRALCSALWMGVASHPGGGRS